MKIKSLNVEELSREMKRNKSIAIQELSETNPRLWVFRGERLIQLREQDPENAGLPENSDVYLVCEDNDMCQQHAEKLAANGRTVYYLAGGRLAWNQFFHTVIVGFDEQIKVWQIHRLAKGFLSYMIASGEQALIVDPSYHIDYYLGLAHREQTDIQCVVDTQIHRDHVSGGARLAAKTGSPYYVPSHKELKADSEPLEKQSDLSVGDARIEVIHFTPLSASDHTAIGLLINNRFLLSGGIPLRGQTFQTNVDNNQSLERSSRATMVLPSHARTLASVNEHGLVATTLGALTETGRTRATPITVAKPPVTGEDIYTINLTQEKIDLAQANELELGIDTGHTGDHH